MRSPTTLARHQGEQTRKTQLAVWATGIPNEEQINANILRSCSKKLRNFACSMHLTRTNISKRCIGNYEYYCFGKIFVRVGQKVIARFPNRWTYAYILKCDQLHFKPQISFRNLTLDRSKLRLIVRKGKMYDLVWLWNEKSKMEHAKWYFVLSLERGKMLCKSS